MSEASLQVWLDAPLPRWAHFFGLGIETPKFSDALAIIAAVVAIAGGGSHAAVTLGFDSPLSPFAAEQPGQLAPLLARLVLLALALRGGSTLVASGVGVIFLASLASRILTIPDVLTSMAAIRLCRQTMSASSSRVIPSWTIALVIAIGAAALFPRYIPISTPPPTAPQEATAF